MHVHRFQDLSLQDFYLKVFGKSSSKFTFILKYDDPQKFDLTGCRMVIQGSNDASLTYEYPFPMEHEWVPLNDDTKCHMLGQVIEI